MDRLKNQFSIKKIFPNTLRGRLMLILLVPMILVQLTVGVVFWDRHWVKTTETMANQVASSINFLINCAEQECLPFDSLQKIANQYYDIQLSLQNSEQPLLIKRYSRLQNISNKWHLKFLEQALTDKIAYSYTTHAQEDLIVVMVNGSNKQYCLKVNKSHVLAKTTTLFIWWEIGAPLFFLLIAIFFIRHQVRPLQKLAQIVENFGKGMDKESFKLSGAKEIRQVGHAFKKMRLRIQEHIKHRTHMLSCVSHDLRTPLTRMRLQIALLDDKNAAKSLSEDIEDMENMVNEYLSFVRNQETEDITLINIKEFLTNIINKLIIKNDKLHVNLSKLSPNLKVPCKMNGITRALRNIIDNATRYGPQVWLSANADSKSVYFICEDNGPGIPLKQREHVFEPFTRIDDSRNSETGGYGLGLSISRDIINTHGGSIKLYSSQYGGLKVIITIPLGLFN